MPDAPESAELTALEFLSNEELIAELLRRSTFAGVLIYFPHDAAKIESGGLIHGDMKASWRNQDLEQVCENLQLTINAIKAQQATGG